MGLVVSLGPRLANFLLSAFLLIYLANNLSNPVFDRYIAFVAFLDLFALILSRGHPYEIMQSSVLNTTNTIQSVIGGHTVQLLFIGTIGAALSFWNLTVFYLLIGGALLAFVNVVNSSLRVRGEILYANIQPFLLRPLLLITLFSGLFMLYGDRNEITYQTVQSLVLIAVGFSFLWCFMSIIYRYTIFNKLFISWRGTNLDSAISFTTDGLRLLLTINLVSLLQPDLAAEFKFILTLNIAVYMIYNGLFEDSVKNLRECLTLENGDRLRKEISETMKKVRILTLPCILFFIIFGQHGFDFLIPGYSTLYPICVLSLLLRITLSLTTPYELLTRLVDRKQDAQLQIVCIVFKILLVSAACFSANLLIIVVADGVSDLLKRGLFFYCHEKASRTA